MSRPRTWLPFVIYLLIVIIILCSLSLLVGSTKISASKVLESMFTLGNSNTTSIIWQVRMPRLVLAVLSGALLAVAGSILLGIFGTAVVDSVIIRIFYLLASAAAAISVFMILFGVNLGLLYPLLLGSLAGATWEKVLITGMFVLASIVVYVFYYKDMNALLFGKYTAKTLGVEVVRIKIFLFIVVLAISAAAVYACGFLCLAGLILPYFVRLVVGVNYKYLIPISMLSSASLIILLDIFSRIVFPAELPLGVIVMAVSGPFYVYALQRRRLGL
ncbi:MAG: iron chelate uptake ABC transporter family permease subunit [bacterium]